MTLLWDAGELAIHLIGAVTSHQVRGIAIRRVHRLRYKRTEIWVGVRLEKKD